MSCIQRIAWEIALPGTKALIAQQIQAKYILGAKSVPEEQVVNASAKAYAEVWQHMSILLLNQHCAMRDTITIEFSAKVHEKACRIIEAKRRRGAVHAQNDSRIRR